LIAVDTSALMAIIKNEAERALLMQVLKQADRVLISAGTVIEARVVAHRRGGKAMVETLDDLLATLSAEVIPVEEAEADIAHAAFAQYGKGGGHPAQLNFGDLFSYAIAKSRGVPLLYKGDDFVHTDIASAVD
jgi:ribonuclease VapC